MGAANVLAAYRMWGEKVPATSMLVLIYMAATSLDSDEDPWYARGHEHLAEHVLHRPGPVTKNDLRAVERAMTPLLRIGAVEVERRGAVRRDGPSTALYRLSLGPADTRRKVSGVPDGEDPPHPTKSDADTRRFVASHPTKSGTHTRRFSSGQGVLGEVQEEDKEKSSQGASSSQGPYPAARDDDDAPQRSKTARKTKAQRKTEDLTLARNLIGEHTDAANDGEVEQLIAWYRDTYGTDWPGAYIKGIVDQDGEDKVNEHYWEAVGAEAVTSKAPPVEPARPERKPADEQRCHNLAVGLVMQIAKGCPGLTSDDLELITDTYQDALMGGATQEQLVDVLDPIFRDPTRKDVVRHYIDAIRVVDPQAGKTT